MRGNEDVIRPSKPVVIVGAGWAGLLAGAFLQQRGIPVRVYEASKSVAGLAASVTDPEGFTFDYGAHFVSNRLARVLGVEGGCTPVQGYGEAVWTGGRALSQPFGLISNPRYIRSAVGARMRRLVRRPDPVHTADGWLRSEYGDVFASDIAIPLLEQWSGVAATQLSIPAIGDVPQGVFATAALRLASRLTGRSVAIAYSRERGSRPWVWLVYPRGGIAAFCSALAERLKGSVYLGTAVERIVVDNNRVRAVRVGGELIDVSAVVSTVPAPLLAKLVEGSSAVEPMARFKYRAMVFTCVKLEGTRLLPSVITWTPDVDLPFFRLSEPPAAVPIMAPQGKTYITMDIGAEVGDDVWRMEEEALVHYCIQAARRVVPDIHRRVLGYRVLRTPFAYPIFLQSYESERRRLAEKDPIDGLVVAGRNGEFAPLLMEDVYWRTQMRMQHLVRDLMAVH